MKSLILLALAGVVAAAPIKMADQVVDMSYSYVGKNAMPYYPGNTVFTIKELFKGTKTIGYNTQFASKYEFTTGEHGGTHYDAPSHFCNKPHCWKPEDIPVKMFYGEACVVDVRENANKTKNYGLSVKDLQNYEKKYGKIPDGAYVIMYSGWGSKYTDKKAYMGDVIDIKKMAWPSFSPDAVKWLIDNRDIKALGVDSLSLDTPDRTFKMAHILFLGRNKIGFENLANVEKIPARGATIVAFPMKIKGGSGGPARVVAMWNNGAIRGTSVSIVGLLLLTALTTLLQL